MTTRSRDDQFLFFFLYGLRFVDAKPNIVFKHKTIRKFYMYVSLYLFLPFFALVLYFLDKQYHHRRPTVKIFINISAEITRMYVLKRYQFKDLPSGKTTLDSVSLIVVDLL